MSKSQVQKINRLHKIKMLALFLVSFLLVLAGSYLKLKGKNVGWGGIVFFGFGMLVFLFKFFKGDARTGNAIQFDFTDSDIVIRSKAKSRKIPLNSIRLIAENTDLPSIHGDHFLVLIHDQGIERWEFQNLPEDFFSKLGSKFKESFTSKLANSIQFKSTVHWPDGFKGDELFYLDQKKIYIRPEIASPLKEKFPQIDFGAWHKSIP